MSNEKKFTCDLCGHKVATAATLGTHKRLKHGIIGQSAASKAARAEKLKQRLPKPGLPCPDCEFVAQSQGGLTKHKNSAHRKEALAKVEDNQIPVIQTNGNGYAPHDDASHRLEAAATFACGRITELLTSTAIRHDLPPRTLASLVLRTLGQTAKVR